MDDTCSFDPKLAVSARSEAELLEITEAAKNGTETQNKAFKLKINELGSGSAAFVDICNMSQIKISEKTSSGGDAYSGSAAFSCVSNSSNFGSVLTDTGLTLNHGFMKNYCGLSLDTLDRLSPSMVTLQSLASDWPPNTVDSGYGPSPQNANMCFSYSYDDIDDCGHETSMDEKCTPISVSQEKARKKYNAEYVSPGGSANRCSFQDTPKRSTLLHSVECLTLSATPPIAIPGSRNVTNQRYIKDFTSSANEPNADRRRKKPINEPYNAHEDIGIYSNAVTCSSERHAANAGKSSANATNVRSNWIAASTNVPDELRNVSSSPRGIFRRPRTNSCPESSRPTPPRPPVPLFPFFTPGPPNYDFNNFLPIPANSSVAEFNTNSQQFQGTNPVGIQDANERRNAFLGQSSNNKNQHQSSSSGCYQPRGNRINPSFSGHSNISGAPGLDGFVHTRNWSTPVAMDRVGPTLFGAAAAQVPLKSAGSRDAIVELSDDGPGHRRRVLVLALPDVVVDTTVRRTVNARACGTADDSSGEESRTYYSHSRQDSGTQDSLPPLACPASIADARARRRAWCRPRALSCDVTLEETVGRALRRMADDLEAGKRTVNEPASLFSRVRRSVRRSFSRILIGRSDDEDEVQHRRGGNSNITADAGRVRAGDEDLSNRTFRRAHQGLHYSSSITSTVSSSSQEDCCSVSFSDADLAFYEIELLEENERGEPRYSMTKRGGNDNEYYL